MEKQSCKHSSELLKAVQSNSVYRPLPTKAVFDGLDSGEILPIGKHEQLNSDYLWEVLADLFIELFEAFGVEDKTAVKSIQKVCNMIVSQYYYLTPEDIAIFVSMCINGAYGKPYGKLNVACILTWLRLYTGQRLHEAEQESIARAYSDRQEASNISPSQASEALNQLCKRILNKGG